MTGKPWADIWRDTGLIAKGEIVRQLVQFCSSTFDKQQRGIGNLFPDSAKGQLRTNESGESAQQEEVYASSQITTENRTSVGHCPITNRGMNYEV